MNKIPCVNLAGRRARCSVFNEVAGLVVASLWLGISAPDAYGLELEAPQTGTRMVWGCSGPFTTKYDLVVMGIREDVVRYEGEIDDGRYFAEKHRALTGTSLWSRLYGDRRQWFDFEAFSEYRMLKPGESFETAVPAQHGTDRWVWKYNIRLGQLKTIHHPVIGKVKIIPVIERRRVFHGDYWSRMETILAPELGLSVSWEYEDQSGLERCDLDLLEEESGTSVASINQGFGPSVRLNALHDRVWREK